MCCFCCRRCFVVDLLFTYYDCSSLVFEMVFTFVAVDVFLLLLFFIWFLIFKSYIERFIVIECVLFLL